MVQALFSASVAMAVLATSLAAGGLPLKLKTFGTGRSAFTTPGFGHEMSLFNLTLPPGSTV